MKEDHTRRALTNYSAAVAGSVNLTAVAGSVNLAQPDPSAATDDSPQQQLAAEWCMLAAVADPEASDAG